jgi:hypothetical protein
MIVVKGLWMCRVLVPVLWLVMPIIWIVGAVGCVLYEACRWVEEKHVMMRQAWPVLARLSAEQRDAMLGVVDDPPPASPEAGPKDAETSNSSVRS